MGDDAFAVGLGRHLLSGFVHATRPLWKWLGNLETKLIAKDLSGVEVERPIYVTGLARAGTTIVLEIIAAHRDVATHQYRDFPFLFTPWFWHETLSRSAPPQLEAQERAHGDRIMVTPASPEAMEEVLWMAFFDRLHDPARSNVLTRDDTNESFDRFYRDHIRKLLLAHGRTRYAAKENYNVTRLGYLHRLFPDARFVIPVRHPRDHIASLRKQHRIFSEAGEEHPRAIAHLDRVGHFEFGPHRRAINCGDGDITTAIHELWREGEEVRGWARYWATLHRHVHATLREDDALRDATLVLRYEDLCDDTDARVDALLRHCSLDPQPHILQKFGGAAISRPKYYRPEFTADEERAIAEETRDVAVLFGYDET